MPWIEGETAAELAWPLPIDVACRIAVLAGRGLHAAHEARRDDGSPLGLVHRDVSPQNILVSLDGEIRVADFGIAKIEGGPVTQAGFVKGKVRYMAPEQAYCEPVDRRTDVFALGVVLYELMTGAQPFGAEKSEVGLLAAIAGPVAHRAPADIVPSFPDALAKVLDVALAKDPADRYATMTAFCDAIEDAVGRESIEAADVAAEVRKVSCTRDSASLRVPSSWSGSIARATAIH